MEQPQNTTFIQDVISFIDQPLSPSSLNKLKKSCKGQPAYGKVQAEEPLALGAPPAAGGETANSSLAFLYPVGSEVEAQHLHNTTEFNGMRGTVMGHQDGKLLVEFFGAGGQVFDIPSFNVKLTTSVPVPAVPVPAPAPAPLPEMIPVMPPAPPLSSQTANLIEINALKEKLRMAMSHVEVAKDAVSYATQLNALSQEELINVISEMQPTLSRQNISKNWRKIVQIYMAHADKVALGMAGRDMGALAAPIGASSPLPVQYSAASGTVPQGYEDFSGHLESVINFIDKPLSPRTLKEVRAIRHSCSPKRTRSGSP
eukprot:TRINITY_DN6536_c2_g1_i1.p1 TRINITY_DN6536_c2_g1~~TRINITY_DN6536_c2_g1_i1.p1  ORF type:complete len:314 (+),score=45.67 TRINITY_DN6536_c2_g1_i1:89-1030(+)